MSLRLALFTSIGLCGVVALLAASCIPLKVDAECQTRMSDCLRLCPPGEPVGGSDQRPLSSDSRTPCEQRCDDVCR